jgi:hypothetical protein
MPAGTKGFAVALILRSSSITRHPRAGLAAGAKKTKRRTMDRLDLPKHIVEKVERRWAQKLQEQAVAWKSTRSEARSATNRSSSRRSRQHGEAAQNYPSIGERAQVKRGASIKNPGNGSGVLDV